MAMAQPDGTIPRVTALALALPLLWPQPRQAAVAPDTRLRLPVEVLAPAECEGPVSLLRRELAALFGPEAAGKGGTTVRLSLRPGELPRPEEYMVEPRTGAIALSAHDTQGAFWAVHTLATLLSQSRRVPGGYEAAIPKLRDWPDTPSRAFMVQGAWTPSTEELKRNLELMAREHITYFALEFGPQVALEFDPTIARGGRFTKAQAREAIEYGRSLGLKPIGYLNLLGHLERAYEKPPYTQHGGIDLRSDEAYERFVYPILSEMLEVYGPIEYFHCGMDEAWELFRWLSQEGCDPVALLARHVERIDSFLKARGVKLVMWHDMLIAPDLAKELGAPVGPANGGPPQNSAAALARIPKDVVLDYWFYDPLAAYPALDYLRAQGFTVWASPWQTPFSLVRHAQARQAPTMGTLWAGPPGCFASPTFSPVMALYAQAAWDASAAPQDVSPEPALIPAAQRATSGVLWRRRELTFPGSAALLLSPRGARRVSWPGDDVEQHYGVPLVTIEPVNLEPLPDMSKPLAEGAGAASVLLPGGVRVALDGVNAGRGEDQLILYAAPRERTGTNIYGIEVSVSAGGVVLETAGYGSGDHAVPAGGFVLSAHLGPRPEKGRRLESLRPGDRVAVLDAQGEWIGGYAAARLIVELPGGETLRIDGEDTWRGADELVLYHPGYGDGHAGTNEFGVEVVVREGRVAAVRDGVGRTPIPNDGYVLSAHNGATGAKAAALRALEQGDPVHLVLERGGQRYDLAETLAKRRQAYPVGERCTRLFLALSAGASSSPGTRLGEWVVRYADGAAERVPIRYGREALPETGDALPERIDDPVWLIDEPPLRCLVREWPNPRPEQPIREVSFEPAPAVLELGARVLGATAAVAGGPGRSAVP
jgi:Glycosyl hydrolase family 20, domain 2